MRKTLKSIILIIFVLSTCIASAYAQAAQPKDIVVTVNDAGSFTIFTRALTDAGLINTLKGDGPFTVFAPTDEAFAKLADGVLDSLLSDKVALKALLMYHLVPGSIPPNTIVLLEAATTAEGSAVDIEIEGSIIRINKTNVLTSISASNGIIYIIDTVLQLPAK